MKSRVLTALALMPVVLGALFVANPWPILVLAAIAAYVCGREISALLGHPSHAAGAIAALGIVLIPRDQSLLLCAVLALVGLILGAQAAALGVGERSRAAISFAILWAMGPLYALLLLHSNGSPQLFFWKTPLLLAILPLWAGDTAAIFAGRAIGKHLLAPTVSPNKTVEGAVANLIACLAVAIAIGQLIEVDLVRSVLCGLAAGVLGQAGDLFESYIKRRAGVKDSGNLLPGHGGLMDRIDSILFTAPAVAVIFALPLSHS